MVRVPWSNCSPTYAEFSGIPGHIYEFYSIAIDNVGFREQKAPVPETTTHIEDAFDQDGDSVADVDDNYPSTVNTDQADLDGDGSGDLCDDDDDGDGIVDVRDNCPITANTDQTDLDGDGIGNLCDDDAENFKVCRNLKNPRFSG